METKCLIQKRASFSSSADVTHARFVMLSAKVTTPKFLSTENQNKSFRSDNQRLKLSERDELVSGRSSRLARPAVLHSAHKENWSSAVFVQVHAHEVGHRRHSPNAGRPGNTGANQSPGRWGRLSLRTTIGRGSETSCRQKGRLRTLKMSWIKTEGVCLYSVK